MKKHGENFKALLTMSFHQSGRRRAGLCVQPCLTVQALAPGLTPPAAQHTRSGAAIRLMVARRAHLSAAGATGSEPCCLRRSETRQDLHFLQALGPAFDCHPLPSRQTEGPTGCTAELRLNLGVFQTDDR